MVLQDFLLIPIISLFKKAFTYDATIGGSSSGKNANSVGDEQTEEMNYNERKFILHVTLCKDKCERIEINSINIKY